MVTEVICVAVLFSQRVANQAQWGRSAGHQHYGNFLKNSWAIPLVTSGPDVVAESRCLCRVYSTTRSHTVALSLLSLSRGTTWRRGTQESLSRALRVATMDDGIIAVIHASVLVKHAVPEVRPFVHEDVSFAHARSERGRDEGFEGR